MAAFASFYQHIIDPGASQRLSSDRPLAGPARCRRNTFLRGPLGASIGTLGLTCAGTFNAQAANFTCSWNDATANWTTVADWSNCNGTDPNNVGGNTYDVTISQGDPTLTTAVTIGSVTINSPGACSTTGTGAATLTGNLTNGGALDVDVGSGDGGGNLPVGGTLANTKTVQMGDGFLDASAANT